MTYKTNIIGAGKLGKVISKLLVDDKLIELLGVLNRSHSSSAAAVEYIGYGVPVGSFQLLSKAELYLVAVPDDHIAEVAVKLAQSGVITGNEIILHFSGLTPSSALEPCKQLGCQIASLHPNMSFADLEYCYQYFPGTQCAYEGDACIQTQIMNLFNNIGANCFTISPEDKALYHTAACIACNFAITLSDASLQCYEKVGIEKERAMQIITDLMQHAVDNLRRSGDPRKSLTGPIKRGDSTCLAHQQKVIRKLPGLSDTFDSLCHATKAMLG